MSTPTVTTRAQKTLHDGWGRLSQYTLDYRKADGTQMNLTREVYDHGHAAAVLLYDPAADAIVLVRQYRLPPDLSRDDPMLLEVCAGMLDGDAPQDCVKKEALEECAVTITALEHAFTLYASPGSLNEKTYCFLGTFESSAPRDAKGHSQDAGEDIETVQMTLGQARAAIASGAIIDAKTVALIQHLALSRAEAANY